MLSPRRAMYTKIYPSASNKQRDPHNLKQGNKACIDNGAVPLAGQSATVLGSLFCSFIFHFLFGKCFPALLLGVFCLSYILFACVMSIGFFFFFKLPSSSLLLSSLLFDNYCCYHQYHYCCCYLDYHHHHYL